MITKDFLKAVLRGEKGLLKMVDVRMVNVPTYDEVSVSNLYSMMIQRPGMAKYFPDTYPKGRQCCRDYMFNVWHTVHPQDVEKVIKFANE